MKMSPHQGGTPMDSRLISKLEKARRYAGEPHRVKIQECTLSFAGDHSTHTVTSRDGQWHCTCPEFARASDCAHTMAVKYMMQRAFDGANVDHEAHLLTRA